MLKKTILTLVALTLTAGSILGGWWYLHREPATLALPGIVEIQEVRLSSKVGGRVARVAVAEGDRVRPGQPLVYFDVPELQAQYERFVWMVGQAPTNVNTHHHVQVFPPVGRILLDILAQHTPAPYVRRVREPWSALASVPGARCKRLLLTVLGRLCSRRQEGLGYPGSDWLAGITDPPCVADTEFLARWLTRLAGAAVELTCHPGYLDTTLLGRDATPTNGQMQRRPNELRLLRQANYRAACRRANLTLIAPSQLIRLRSRGETHAA